MVAREGLKTCSVCLGPNDGLHEQLCDNDEDIEGFRPHGGKPKLKQDVNRADDGTMEEEVCSESFLRSNMLCSI